MASSLQQLLRDFDAEESAARGPAEGSSPPRQRQRTSDEEEEQVELDPSQLGMVKVFKKEMKILLRENMEEQDAKFEKRFMKLEKKLFGCAQVTDQGFAQMQKSAEQDKAALKKWQSEMEAKLAEKEASVNKAVAALPRSFVWPRNASPGPKQQDEEKDDKKQRTITFGCFPEDTKAEEIKSFIDNILKKVTDEVEESFAYGKKRAERGAARFKSSASMWNYMTANAGEHKHSFKGNTIYVNADGGRTRNDTEKEMEKAVRKTVRLIIEKNGGDGKTIKKTIDTNYRKGVVHWNDERVAEWNVLEQNMILKGSLLEHKGDFDKLMSSK